MILPTPRIEPDEWGAENRIYPPTSGWPGKRNPNLTPYTIPFMRAVADRTHKGVALVMFAQGGKSEAILDIIGHRLDTSPVPILYVGPTKNFITEQWEPRVEGLLDESEALRKKAAPEKKQTKTKKIIAGVPLRLAHAGSSTALKSDPAGLAVSDEVDELVSNVKGSGNPIRLIDDRGNTVSDFVHAKVSTPSEGTVDVEKCPVSGLEFWAEGDAAEISSMIWRIWQSGTRHHYAIPCPHCDDFFIPRSNMLNWKKPILESGKEGKATPAMARDTAHIDCSSCGGEIVDDGSIEDSFKSKGQYIAPGQHFEGGVVVGPVPDAEQLTYWVSGLCNPFQTWGDIAAKLVDAELSNDPEEIKVVMNGTFGELYSPGGGEVPEWAEVAQLRDNRLENQLPKYTRVLIMSVDVQSDRLYYVIRAWGARATSALVEAGVLWGMTNKPPVWDALQDMIDDRYDGRKINRVLIDSGFNPNGKDTLPINRIYAFCAKNKKVCYPTKGYETLSRPLIKAKPEVNKGGDVSKYGLELIRLDTDYWKSWIHERVRWPRGDAGEWTIHANTTDDYCKQIVSEARVKKPGSKKATWVARSRDNHFLDCESMNAAGAYMYNMHKLKTGDEKNSRRKPRGEKIDDPLQEGEEKKPRPSLSKAVKKKKWAILNG